MNKTLLNYYEFALNNKPQHPLDLETANFMCKWIDDHYIFRMLEIGSGIGFSANYFALNTKMTSIVSVEKQFGYYLLCKKYQMSDKIEFVWKNFLDYESITKYPLIFLDAAKSKQIELFEKAKTFLKNKGTIMVDNIFLKRLQDKNTKSSEKLIKKSKEFLEYLNNLTDFEITIMDIGDGLAICQRKE